MRLRPAIRRLSALAFAAALLGGAPVGQAQSRSRSEDAAARLAPGRFLVASRELGDPNFRRTVVVLVDYDRLEGALGLVINRPSEIDLSNVLRSTPDSADEELGRVYVGGPVEPLQFTLLVRSAEPPAGSRRILEDVHFSSSRELLETLARPVGDASVFRAYAGYAGWAIGQLEAEIALGGWHVLDGRVSSIFDVEPDKVWPRLILIGTADWARLDLSERRPAS